ncbi:MAG: uroporphyrinogen decarboxylase family protein, partial [Planctomycetota bacterium]|nr:uroporphyrinogen decarboxylase family protein [Planctomycetota bacterium]
KQKWRRVWFGALAEEQWDGVEASYEEQQRGEDTFFHKTYRTKSGELSERLQYVFAESTLVQKEFLVDDYMKQLPVFREFVAGRRWSFDAERYRTEQQKVGPDGVIVAGELHSPLKMLHFLANPVQTTYMLVDREAEVKEICALHEEAQLDLVRQMAEAGVRVMMAMDNLDSTFHPPRYVEQYSASFYQRAAEICHRHGSLFFIHACGNQKANLPLISSLGVDGLEGVAYPPLGDTQLEEAFAMTHDGFIITGGISGMETSSLTSKDKVFRYVEDLFHRVRPYADRFIFSASCNTSVDASWETLVQFRDAWRELGGN